MTLRLIAPWACYEQRIPGLQAALRIFCDAGLSAEAAETAFRQFAERHEVDSAVVSPAMTRAAVVWRRASDAAQVYCAGGVLSVSHCAVQHRNASLSLRASGPEREQEKC
jgi:hypothetical protein